MVENVEVGNTHNPLNLAPLFYNTTILPLTPSLNNAVLPFEECYQINIVSDMQERGEELN